MQNKGKTFGKSCEGGFALTAGLLPLPVFDTHFSSVQTTSKHGDTLKSVNGKKTHELCAAHVYPHVRYVQIEN